MGVELLKVFEGDDVLFHYTSTETALEFILEKKQLRFSSRKNTNDPIENGDITKYFSGGSLSELSKEEYNYLKSYYAFKLNNIKQLSFCKNEIDNKEYDRQFIKPYEYYGGLKPRMWEQYGNNYNGVCLIFSKDKLLKQINNQFYPDNVNYDKYSILEQKMLSFNIPKVKEIGIENYCEIIFKNIFIKSLFLKHKDYEGENEFRILTFSEKNFEYINYKDSLLGILVSSKGLNKYLYHNFKDISNAIIINWSNNGINPESLNKHLDWINGI